MISTDFSMSEAKRVILIDDDHGPMDYFVDALKMRGFAVQHIDRADDAFDFIRNPASLAPDIFVIDIMMPYGKYLTAEASNDGMDTGFFVIKECREHFPTIPIFGLTYRGDRNVLKERLGAVTFMLKHQTSPFDFADTIAAAILQKESQTSAS